MVSLERTHCCRERERENGSKSGQNEELVVAHDQLEAIHNVCYKKHIKYTELEEVGSELEATSRVTGSVEEQWPAAESLFGRSINGQCNQKNSAAYTFRKLSTA